MIGKRPHPMIGKLSELLVSGSNRGRFLDVGTSPRSLLDYRIQSPRGLKNYELGGVGLGIVAALEKKSSSSGDQGQRAGHEILAKKCGPCSPNLNNRSVPIPFNSGKNCERIGNNKVSTVEDMDMDSLENYTYVISHGPGQKSFTKVYYDGQEYGEVGHDQGFSFDVKSNNLSAVFTLKESPARVVEEIQEYPTSDFLSSCYLCRKKLHGRDIYMYRGERAFCSVECRSSHMMVDERKEKQCRAEVTRSADLAGSSYTRSPIFSAGIVAI